MHVVDLLVVVGIFLSGAETGPLTTFALHLKHASHLKDLLETERNSQTREQEERPELNGVNPPDEGALNDRNRHRESHRHRPGRLRRRSCYAATGRGHATTSAIGRGLQ